MMQELKEFRILLERKKGQKSQLIKDFNLAQNNIKYYKREIEISEEAQLIIQKVAKETQQEIEYQLSELITLSMQSILDEPSEFVVRFEIRRGKTECDLYFLENNVLLDPMEEGAGGTLDIASMALQVALIRISHPSLMSIIISDEPFKHLSKNFHERAGIVLRDLSKRMKPRLQIIMVTHSEKLVENADKVFNVVKKNKKSIVNER